ncbi:DNA primase [bacterium]|nr:DNA primase [bacterium]|tara:strand:- start:3172 stop:4902 length:1731 start_codon:yes stop_codon:yes gene_type:complete
MSGEVEEIKKRIDVVEFLKGYLDLQPAGKNFKALCPFHSEKTPSFVVSPDRSRWHCFGSCGEGGDIFTFLMKYENLEFYEALQVLAERAGVPLRQLDPQKQKEFGILYDINEEANNFFQEELKKNEEALGYLRARGLKDKTIEEFELGYSPGGEALTMHLLQKGHSIEDIVRAGVSYKNRRGMYWDKFQRRIMFPIASGVGKTVAFTGRMMPSDEERGIEAPKYLNSPETLIFSKSKILYGLHLSKRDISKSRTAFLVEGQMDVLMAWQSGVKNVIAVSGTGLTQFHLQRLGRIADTILLSFDNDEAGLKAMERGLDIFGDFDFYVKVVHLGEHKDPADAAQADPEFLKGAMEKARGAFTNLFETRFHGVQGDDVAERKRLVRHFLSKIRGVRSATEQDAWIKELSRVSGVPETALLEEFSSAEAPSSGSPNVISEAEGSESETLDFSSSNLQRVDRICRRLFSLAFAYDGFLEELKKKAELVPNEYRKMLDNPESEDALQFSMQGTYNAGDLEEEILQAEFEGLLLQLHIEALKRQKNEIRTKIRESEQQGSEEDSLRFLEEFQQVAIEMDKLKQ